MDNPIADAITRDLAAVRGLFEAHHTSAEHAAAQPQGDTMSLLSDNLHAAATRIEHFSEENLAAVEAILANPEAAPALPGLAHLARCGLPAGMLADVLAPVRAMAVAYPPPAAQQAQ